MHLTCIRKDSDGGQSPALYRTDRGALVAQGLPSHETAVELPEAEYVAANPLDA
jgi:hypothetical protein